MTVGKRAFDLLSALLGLLALSPLFLCVAAAILLGDGRPALFRQARVGQGGRLFWLWKFRTMVRGAEKEGGPLTIGKDPRITPIGRWLRRWKVDELPQLLNVLLGEMSLVGPRPEVTRYVDQYTATQRSVLELMPGITDPASLHFRDEAALLDHREDAESYYVGTVMPEKIRMNLEYARIATRRSDFKLVVNTLWRLASASKPHQVGDQPTGGLSSDARN